MTVSKERRDAAERIENALNVATDVLVWRGPENQNLVWQVDQIVRALCGGELTYDTNGREEYSKTSEYIAWIGSINACAPYRDGKKWDEGVAP